MHLKIFNNSLFKVIIVMIGIVSGNCKKGNQAVFACSTHQCNQRALMCKDNQCDCQKDHIECGQKSDFSALLQKIFVKKIYNFEKIQQLSQWYQNASKKIIEYRDKLFQKANQCVLRSLGPFEGKLLQYLQNKNQNQIFPRLIKQIEQSIENHKYENKFERNYKQTVLFMQRILNSLGRVPESLLGSFQKPLHIKTATGKKIDINISLTENAESLKKMLSIQQGYSMEQQRLVWAGIQLQNDMPLFNYNLHGGETLHLLLKLYGE